MDQEPEVIRRRIEATRTALTEKVETLEREVRGTVCGARDAVTDVVSGVRGVVADVSAAVHSAIEGARETMHDATASMHEALNMEQQTQRHPWIVMGGSIAAGYALGSILPGNNHKNRTTSSIRSERETVSAPSRLLEEPAVKSRGVLDSIMDEFRPELEKVKRMAIGTAMGLIRDVVKQQIPEQLAGDFAGIVDSVTTKLGGKPVSEPIIADVARETRVRDTASARRDPDGPIGARREGFGERRFDY